MKKLLAVITVSCMALTACSVKSGGNKIEQKGPDEAVSQSNNNETDDSGTAEEGKKAPDITVEKFDGTAVSISDLEGKPTMIVFWATWCGYCVEEFPAVQKLKDNYGDKINILALNCGDTKEDAEEFINQSGYTFDNAMVDYDSSLKYSADSIPVSVIIDKDGIVKSYMKGSAGADAMYDTYWSPVIDELLEE